MIKRVVSFFTAFSMTLMMFGALNISALLSGHTHKACANSNHADCTHSEIEYEPFPAGNNSDSITSDKNYYLTGNVELPDTQIYINNAAVNICLNGYTFKIKGIRVSGGAVLNVCDCGSGGCFTTEYENAHGILEARTGSTLNIYSGKIQVKDLGIAVHCGSPDEDSSVTNIYGGEINGNVLVNNGDTLSVYGGTIKHDTANPAASRTGISVLDRATVNINGGSIFGGEYGISAVYSDSTININGGSVESKDKYAIWIQNRTVCNITGGTVTSASTEWGTIYTLDDGVVNINGGTITSADTGYCAVHVGNGGFANINGGNLTAARMPTVWVGSGGTANITGGNISTKGYSNYVYNNGTLNISGGVFSANSNNVCYIANYKTFSLQGAPTLVNTGILLGNKNNITIGGALTNTEAYPIYVTSTLPRIFTNGWDTYMSGKKVTEHFKSPYDFAKIVYKDNEAVMVYCYNITYDANGGSCSEQVVSANASDKLTSLATATRDGYIFAGWFTEAVGGEQVTTDTVFTNDTTIYAHWTCDHDWGDTYQNDDDQHWQICTKCGAESEKSDHEWDDGEVTKPSTETEEGEMTYKCTVCSATKIESIDKIHTHTFSDTWSSDETHHWHASTCGHTEAVDGKEEHIFIDGKCSVCQRPDPNYETPTDTSVSETLPPETDPSDTGSSGTQPPETDPSDTGSSGTQPSETDPSDTEPIVTNPPVTESEPIVTQPPVTEPTITVPTVTEPPVTEPTATVPTYVPYYPPSSAPAHTVSVKREPFLQDENGKIGWEVISGEIWKTPDGETVRVNMNGTTKLPKSIVSDIAGRDIDLVLIMNTNFTWTINGMSVTKARDVDMTVKKMSKIPESTVRKFFGDSDTVQLDLRHSGDFGFIAELTVYIGNRFSGMYANSYCCKSKNFEFGDSAEITDGLARLRFSHASRWLIVIDGSPVLEDVSSGAAAHSGGAPMDMSASASGVHFPEFDEKKRLRLSNKKRRYRILKKRKLDDVLFVL